MSGSDIRGLLHHDPAYCCAHAGYLLDTIESFLEFFQYERTRGKPNFAAAVFLEFVEDHATIDWLRKIPKVRKPLGRSGFSRIDKLDRFQIERTNLPHLFANR
jgi:hypothetical protein